MLRCLCSNLSVSVEPLAGTCSETYNSVRCMCLSACERSHNFSSVC